MREFPIQNVGMIPWSVAERAYEVYAMRRGRAQSIERMAERGGFGLGELGDLLQNGRMVDFNNAQDVHRACEYGAREILNAIRRS